MMDKMDRNDHSGKVNPCFMVKKIKLSCKMFVQTD